MLSKMNIKIKKLIFIGIMIFKVKFDFELFFKYNNKLINYLLVVYIIL